ncbi:MAG: bifunctional 2-polyprenyl-6-hydroxyphenol methylase/3-demethylubiquinol 3-O-methyltransferase UbiG [Hyphomicrobiales bacterium]|nr:bifunctional 2-polyprenyl-6-hydroxyphenol methylase/3-demethylubiquinol 3-O-methyltransferase UbiG [Hyphomicrobiales bacterium]
MTEPSSAVDPREMETFRAAAADWWRPGGKFAPLHALGPSRMTFVRAEIEERFGRQSTGLTPFAGLRVADIGCGGGLLSEPLARLGAEVVGVDPLPESIAVAREHAAQQGLAIDYRVGEASGLPPESFDALVAMEVIEHTPNPAAFVVDCARLLRPGGVLLLSTINRTARAYALAIVGAEYVLNWLPRGTHRWEKFVTPAELEAACSAAGLASFRARGCVYNPLTGAWRLSSDCAVNYFGAASKTA